MKKNKRTWIILSLLLSVLMIANSGWAQQTGHTNTIEDFIHCGEPPTYEGAAIRAFHRTQAALQNGYRPFSKKTLEFIFNEDESGIYIYGFRYLDAYFWKPKRDASNASPELVNAIEDVALPKRFDTYTIDLADVFRDAENDDLRFFAASTESSLVSASIVDQQLILSGGSRGKTRVQIMAIDENGGLACQEFNVQVGKFKAPDEVAPLDERIFLDTDPVTGAVVLAGDLLGCRVILRGIESDLFREITPVVNGTGKLRINLSDYRPGIYEIEIKDVNTGESRLERVYRY